MLRVYLPAQGSSAPAQGLAEAQGFSAPAHGLAEAQGSSAPAQGLAEAQGFSAPAQGLAEAQGSSAPAQGFSATIVDMLPSGVEAKEVLENIAVPPIVKTEAAAKVARY